MRVLDFIYEPEENLSTPWCHQVLGWDWESGRIIMEPIPRTRISESHVQFDAPAGSIIAYGRKWVRFRNSKSKMRLALVLHDGDLFPITREELKEYFRTKL